MTFYYLVHWPFQFCWHWRFPLPEFWPPLDSWGALVKNDVLLSLWVLDLMALTWSTSSIDLWINSGPNNEGATSLKFESSSSNGSKDLFKWVITLVLCTWLICALAFPSSWIAAFEASRAWLWVMVSPLVLLSSREVRAPEHLRWRFVTSPIPYQLL